MQLPQRTFITTSNIDKLRHQSDSLLPSKGRVQIMLYLWTRPFRYLVEYSYDIFTEAKTEKESRQDNGINI